MHASENTNPGKRFFMSWSGGKDSCLSLYRMLTQGHTCASLFTMVDPDHGFSRSHGLTTAMLLAQTSALGLPLTTASATWESYEPHFIQVAQSFASQGIQAAVFGDIDLQAHKDWEERICAACGLTPYLPLWGEHRETLVREFIDLGFQALIVTVDERQMPIDYLGKTLDHALVDRMLNQGIDPCGENGEFHTFVFDGPLFRRSVYIHSREPRQIDHHHVLIMHPGELVPADKGREHA